MSESPRPAEDLPEPQPPQSEEIPADQLESVDPLGPREPRTFTLQPRPSLLRFLTEHNPFYLLSAACMLASCLALTNSLSWTSISRTRLLTLIVTLNVYEAALLAIALFLITRRQLRRDGRMLLLLQAFFLADFTFLNAEIATADPRTGLLVNVVLLGLAAAKMGVVLRVLRPTFTAVQFGFVMTQFAVLCLTPLVLRWADGNRGTLGPREFYAVWWVVGLLPAAYELLSRADPRGRVVSLSPDARTAPTTAYLALPYVSLLAHVGVLHWVYRADYVAAHAAPLLLGLTMVLNRFSPMALLSRKDLLALRLLLPAVAVLVSVRDPFRFDTPWAFPPVALTPFNLALVGAFLVYLYCFLLPYARLVLIAGATVAAVHVFGPTWQQVDRTVQSGWARGTGLADRLIPKTLGDWGLIGLVASFTFLAIGFWLSLRKAPELAPVRAEEEDPGPTPSSGR